MLMYEIPRSGQYVNDRQQQLAPGFRRRLQMEIYRERRERKASMILERSLRAKDIGIHWLYHL